MEQNIIQGLEDFEHFYNECLFTEAFELCLQLFKDIEYITELETKNVFLFELARKFVDLGHASHNKESSEIGLNILEEHKDDFLLIVTQDSYLYCLANAKHNLIQHKTSNIFHSTISEIEDLVEVSNILWKAIVYVGIKNAPPFYLVNIANIHKQQNRVCEAMRLYDIVCNHDLDIPQAWINRSECLRFISDITGSYSQKMLSEISKGYLKASQSKNIPYKFALAYKKKSEDYLKEIDDTSEEEHSDYTDEELTKQEFENMSKYRKWTLQNYLSLSEHSLYCKCIVTDKDSLTIPDEFGKVIGGTEIFAMEMVLNRLKSEFGFARRLFFEYVHQPLDANLENELCFSEMYDGELLGYKIEKLKTSFKLCFGILDKIATAIADFFDFKPAKGNVYFQNFWRLGDENRRKKFEEIHNEGLLALYSIACDLNSHKNGELSFYKKWRNTLEHNFLIVYEHSNPAYLLDAETCDNSIYVNEAKFIEALETMLQITRSAIFSFVYSIRVNSYKQDIPKELTSKITLNKKNFHANN